MTAVVRTLGSVDLLDYTHYRTPDEGHSIQHSFAQIAYARRDGGLAHAFTKEAGSSIKIVIYCVALGSAQNAEDAKDAVLAELDLAFQHNNPLVPPIYYEYQYGDMALSRKYQILTIEDYTETLPPGVDDIELSLSLRGNQIR